MMDWESYYNEADTGEEMQVSEQELKLSKDGTIFLTDEMLADYIRRLSGIDEVTGLAKSEITYQAYDYDAKDDMERERIYTVSNAAVQIARNRQFDDLFVVDIIFKNAEDTELKLFWGRLQKHLKNQSNASDKNWIFYINLLERAGIRNQTEQNDALLTANILNPVLTFLTREVPNQRVADALVGGEMQGGNIIRMLVPSTLLTYHIATDIDTNEIKGEVLRDIEAARYLDNCN